MKLNRETKHHVKVGDRIRFSDNSTYLVTGVISGTDRAGSCGSVSYTIRDERDGRTIYAHPSSACYGAEFISAEE